MDVTQLQALADEAYGAALASNNVAERSYAAGVEDLARYLIGAGPVPPRIAQMLQDVAFTARSKSR